MSVNHYENFPVASILVPRQLRQAVIDIYHFARTADDIADEGNALPHARQQQLDEYRQCLQTIEHQDVALGSAHPLARVFNPLRQTITKHNLPFQPFYDLLSAFSQDVYKTRYTSEEELFDYCARSANPVGHLMLRLYQADTPTNRQQADCLCTGLQLTNFWQDIVIDWNKGRVYLPQDKMAEFEVAESYIAHKHDNDAWRALMRDQTQKARTLLHAGFPLARIIGGRAGFELKLVALGGLRILERLEQLNYNLWPKRPTLTKSDWVLLIARAFTRQTKPDRKTTHEP